MSAKTNEPQIKPLSPTAKLWRTTTFRLSLLYLGLFSIFSVALLGYVYFQTNHLLSRQILDRLDTEVRSLETVASVGGVAALVRVIDRRSSRPSASVYLLINSDGNAIAGNISEIPANVLNRRGLIEFDYSRETDLSPRFVGRRLPTDVEAVLSGENRRALGRVYTLPGNMRLIVGRDLGERERFELVMFRALKLALLLTLVVGVAGGILISRRVLKRIEAIDETSRAIMAGDLSERVPVQGSGDELDRLAQSLNAMLERIENLMCGLKEVSDNIAHDLRTPLTRLKNQAETALSADLTLDEAREALNRTLEEADGLISTFNALLLIARAEAGGAPDAMRPFDGPLILSDMAELYEPVAEERGAVITTDAPDDLPLKGNRELIAQALSNLIDNALKYGLGNAAPRLTLSLKEEGGFALFSLADNGVGIPLESRKKVMERFYRLDESRTEPGSGLGLSLVRAAAQFHGGQVVLDSATKDAENPGLIVTLKLPILAPRFKADDKPQGEMAA